MCVILLFCWFAAPDCHYVIQRIWPRPTHAYIWQILITSPLGCPQITWSVSNTMKECKIPTSLLVSKKISIKKKDKIGVFKRTTDIFVFWFIYRRKKLAVSPEKNKKGQCFICMRDTPLHYWRMGGRILSLYVYVCMYFLSDLLVVVEQYLIEDSIEYKELDWQK